MSGRWSNPFATSRRMFVLGGLWATGGATEVLLAVVWHASGVGAVLGVFWLLLASVYFAMALQQRRRERRISDRSPD